MKNKMKFLYLIFLVLLFNKNLFAENISIESKNIILDKGSMISVFENDVVIKTDTDQIIKSDYAEYDKLKNTVILKKNVSAIDKQNNIVESEYAEYNEKLRVFKSIGKTRVITAKQYIVESSDVILNNKKKIIQSNKKTIITDQDNNKIFLENFEYDSEKNIFKSVGLIKVEDNKKNSYNFSQIYIDTKKKEILGTDLKAFLNEDSLKFHRNNKPRIFANTLKMNNDQNIFKKSIFTMCNYRENDKCPPWTIQASEMLHDNKSKTIYYNNAVIKVYNVPIFYIPRLSHPDPSVDRRSGFLAPSFTSTKNLGTGMSIPYFWAMGRDKNLTLKNNLYFDENPLFLAEYHQVFKHSSLISDFGYTEGYKKTSKTKKPGEKSHFFSKFVKNFENNLGNKSTLNLTAQTVSNDKYLKLYKIKSNLVDYNENSLENSINFSHESDESFFGLNASIYETLTENYNDKYEYILPEIVFDKVLINDDKIGNIDLQANLKLYQYDTNRSENFLINDLNWNSNIKSFTSGLKGKFLGKIKNINYETKNIDIYKKDHTNELYGAFGYLSELDLIKEKDFYTHTLKPKILVRYAPGEMRKETSGSRLDPSLAFNMNRLSNTNNFETGLTAAVGFDYKTEQKNNVKQLDFSVAQIISEKENKKMSSTSSMDEKLSDLVGSSNFKLNSKVALNYNFSVDQNYNQFNYNEIGTELNLSPFIMNFNYLKESEHIGDQEYFKTKIDLSNENRLVSFETKRNLIKNSSEFYNLSYEYLNDCLRAGLVYRREFYVDSEIEPENSLMFKITLTPFGNINSPSFN